MKKNNNKQTNIKWMYSLFVYHETRGSVIRQGMARAKQLND